MSDKLYGLEGDEYLERDPAAVYERWADDHDFPDCLTYPSPGDLPRAFEGGQLEIQEWSSVPGGNALPSASRILEWMYDGFADEAGFVEASDQLERHLEDPDVVAAFSAARDLLASKVHFLLADKLLRTLVVTWDERNEPLLDGEPMYRSAT